MRPRPQLPPAPTPRPTTPATKPLSGIPQVGGRLGRPTAAATLTIYADVSSPAFTLFDRRVVPTLLQRYVRPGRLALQLRTLPSRGLPAPGAAALSQAAGLQSQLWQFVRTLSARDDREPLAAARAVPGLDVARLRRDAGSERALAAVNRAKRLAFDDRANNPPAFRLVARGRTQRLEASTNAMTFTRALDAVLPNG